MVKDNIGVIGTVHITVIEKDENGDEHATEHDFKNTIVTVGKDTILRYLGNIIGGAKMDKIGVGDSTQAVSVGDTSLAGTNTLVKTISTAARVYVRPTLFVSVEYGYTEANFTWNEVGLFDTNNVLIARQIDSTPLVKTSTKRAIVEWQLTI